MFQKTVILIEIPVSRYRPAENNKNTIMMANAKTYINP
jgi:hypothetical protein